MRKRMKYTGVYKNLVNRRAVARLRSEYPLLFFLPSLVLGQMLGWFSFFVVPTSLLILILFILALLTLICEAKWLAMGLANIVLGIVLMYSPMSFPLQDLPTAADSLLVFVDRKPRYKRPGEVRLSLTILGMIRSGDEVLQISDEGLRGRRILCQAVDLPWKNISGADRSSVFAMRAYFRKIIPELNPFSYSSFLLRQGYSATCRIRYTTAVLSDQASMISRAKRKVVAKIRGLKGSRENAAVFMSMSLGVRDQISDRTERAFKRTGLAHILVVSGLQVTLVFYLLRRTLCFLLKGSIRLSNNVLVYSLTYFVPAMGSVFYVLFAGIEGSSLRAAIAVVLVVLSRLFERGGGLLNGILTSFLVLSFIWPGAFLEPGLQLSYAALGGICLGLSYQGGCSLIKFLRMCLAASLFTSIICSCWFDHMSSIGFLVNPLLAPLFLLCGCKLGLLSLLVYLSGLDGEGWVLRFCLWQLSQLREIMLWGADWSFAALEFSTIPRSLVITILLAVALKLLWKRYIDYLLENNLFRY